MESIQTAVEVIDNGVMPKFHKHSGRHHITFDVKTILTGTATRLLLSRGCRRIGSTLVTLNVNLLVLSPYVQGT
jgi:hypothetical protein